MSSSNLSTIEEIRERAKAAANIEMTPSVCQNMSQFKSVLRQLRQIDDNIILRLNTTNTASRSECLQLFEVLKTAYRQRQKDIDRCVGVLDDRIKQESERSFRLETQRDWVVNERSVESIIRRRSLDVLQTRCPFIVANDEE